MESETIDGFRAFYNECGERGWIVELHLFHADDCFGLVVRDGQRELSGMRFKARELLGSYRTTNFTGARLDQAARKLRERMVLRGYFAEAA